MTERIADEWESDPDWIEACATMGGTEVTPDPPRKQETKAEPKPLTERSKQENRRNDDNLKGTGF